MAHSTDYASRVGEIIRAELKARKISPTALQDLTGISRMTIERRLKGFSGGFNLAELKVIGPHIGMTPGQITLAAEREVA